MQTLLLCGLSPLCRVPHAAAASGCAWTARSICWLARGSTPPRYGTHQLAKRSDASRFNGGRLGCLALGRFSACVTDVSTGGGLSFRLWFFPYMKKALPRQRRPPLGVFGRRAGCWVQSPQLLFAGSSSVLRCLACCTVLYRALAFACRCGAAPSCGIQLRSTLSGLGMSAFLCRFATGGYLAPPCVVPFWTLFPASLLCRCPLPHGAASSVPSSSLCCLQLRRGPLLPAA